VFRFKCRRSPWEILFGIATAVRKVSVLANDGTIHILQHGTLNTTALTATDLPATSRCAPRTS